MTDKEIIKKYPFARVYSFKGEALEYSWLELIPSVWAEAFGEQMLEDLAKAIKRSGAGKVHIIDMKEKYGELRIQTDVYNEEIERVIDKYEKISRSIPCYRR